MSIFELELTNFSKKVKYQVAKKLYDNIRELRASDEFPYDKNQKRSRDKRKLWGFPWHLWSFGAAFVGDEKVIGPYYKGETPLEPSSVITLSFENIKSWRDDVFDYGSHVLDEIGLFDVYPTDSEIDDAIEEALNLVEL